MADERQDGPAQVQPPRDQPAPNGRSIQHVECVARIIGRRLRAGGKLAFGLVEIERVNRTTGWTYRYLMPTGHVVRVEGVSLPSDDLLDAWRLARQLAGQAVAA